MSLSKTLRFASAALLLSLALPAAVVSAATYVPPTQNPPNCPDNTPGCDAPIHTGTPVQYKKGSLGILSDLVGMDGFLIDMWTAISGNTEAPGLFAEGGGFFGGILQGISGVDVYGDIISGAGEPDPGQFHYTARFNGKVGAHLYCDITGTICWDPTTTSGPGGGSGDSLWATSSTNINNIYNKNTGNVGVGTNNPETKFHVVSSGPLYQAVFEESSTDVGGIAIRNATANGQLELGVDSTGVGFISSGKALSGAINIDSSLLNVNSQVKITGGAPGLGKVLQSDATGLASWVATSSLGIGSSVTNIFNTTSWPWASTSPTSDIVYARNTVSPYGGGVAIGVAPASANINAQLQVLGKVAIGNDFTTTLIPTNNIHVKDNDPTQTGIDIENSSAGGHRWRMQTVGSGVSGRVGNFEIWDAGAPSVIGITIKPATDAVTGLPTSNIGIGTFNPTARLEVAGQVKITGGAPGLGKVLLSDATGLASWVATSTLGISGGNSFWADRGSNNISNINSGNVGVGTANPTTKLDVNGGLWANTVTSGVVYGGNHFTNNNAGYWFGTPGTYSTGLWQPPSSSNVVIRTNNVDRVTVTNTGNTELSGQIKIAGGAPGAGKVLQSDATGLASWVATSSLGFSNPTFVLDTVIAKSPTGGSAEVKVAVCPAGYKVMGGGFQEISDTNDDQDASAPLSSRTQNYNDPTATDRWYCEDDPGPSVCYAVCGRIIQQ